MRLADLAKVVRSKNAGPYLLTCDVIFSDADTLEWIRSTGSLTPTTVAAAYGVGPSDVLDFAYYPFVHAVKFSIRRPHVSGSRFDNDVYGAQQHAPLLELHIPERGNV